MKDSHPFHFPDWLRIPLLFLKRKKIIRRRTFEYLCNLYLYKDFRIIKSGNRNTIHGAFLRKTYKVCKICGDDKKLTQDHIIPLAKGGSNRLANKQLLCEKCNSEKGHSLDY